MNNNVLIIAAHPDDEALGCAGTMAKYISAGSNVHVAFMTNGVSSRNLNLIDEAKDRKKASHEATQILGVSSTCYFDFPDNKMDSIALIDVVNSIEGLITELKPDVIYTHHVGDLNVDHQITCKATITACRPQPGLTVKEIFSFEVLSSTDWQVSEYLPFTPNIFIDISEQIEIKKEALKAYSDEMRQSPHSRSIDNVIRLNALRGNSVGLRYAEAFCLLRKIN